MVTAVNRLAGGRHADVINHARRLLPGRLAERLADVHYLTGVDPVFVGLHTDAAHANGGAYADVDHYVRTDHQVALPRARRAPTIVLPGRHCSVDIVIHELGHALDDILGHRHFADPVSAYAKSSWGEAFAEAFTSWLYHGYGYASRPDAATCALFRTLATGAAFPHYTWEVN